MRIVNFVTVALMLACASYAGAAEPDKNCTLGAAYGQIVPTDCSVFWENAGKIHCFSSEAAKAEFLKNPEENLKKAMAFREKMMAPENKTAAVMEKLSAEQVREMLKKASPSNIVDFSGKDLSYNDLRGLDLRYGKFVDTNLFGADLRGSNFSGADLTKAYMNLARLENVNLSGANLTDATIFQAIFDKTNFKGANLSNARVIGTLGNVDMSGATIKKGRFGLDVGNQPMGQMKFDSVGGNFANADFEGADLNIAAFTFGNLSGANLRNTNMNRADLNQANLTGADLTGADLTNAEVDGAIFKDVKGLETVKGFDTVKGKCVGCK